MRTALVYAVAAAPGTGLPALSMVTEGIPWWTAGGSVLVSLATVLLLTIRGLVDRVLEHREVQGAIAKAAPDASLESVTSTVVALRAARLQSSWRQWRWRR